MTLLTCTVKRCFFSRVQRYRAQLDTIAVPWKFMDKMREADSVQAVAKYPAEQKMYWKKMVDAEGNPVKPDSTAALDDGSAAMSKWQQHVRSTDKLLT